MSPTIRRLIVGSLALIYISFAVYFFATIDDWFFAAFHVVAALYCYVAIWYMLEAASQRHYGRVIFYAVSVQIYSLAMSGITDQLATPEGALPRVKRYFAERLDRLLSYIPSEYLMMLLACLVIGNLIAFLVRRYWVQNKEQE